MSKEIFNTIKKLRLARGISQAEMAQKVGIARTSYLAVEQGKRELTLAEAAKIADVLGLSLEELEGGSVPNYAKYKEMILACLRVVAPTDGKVPKTKLAKLLYLADFAWFYEHLTSMSGMSYRKIQYGPVPVDYFRAVDELFEEGKINIENAADGAMLISETSAARRDRLSDLSVNEKNLIGKIGDKWKRARTQEIVEFTHQQLPYLVSRENEVIPYEVITQENPGHVY